MRLYKNEITCCINMTDNTHKMFGPLNFKEYKPENLENSTETNCLLCDDVFNLKLCFEIFLKHLFEVHYLVIEDVQNIHNLQAYIKHWRERFAKANFETYVPSIVIDTTEHKYFLLSTLMKEDKELRHRLKLDWALNTQELERTDTSFKRQCLLCRLQYEGLRSGYITHLSEQHNLQLGNPQNLVFVDKLFNHLEEILNSLQCIFCERKFRDRSVLKEHMRKKIHKRINSKNSKYDKYYMVNYAEDGNEHTMKDRELDELPIPLHEQNSDSEYSDWQEGDDNITCLFCLHTEITIDKLCMHMHTVHRFNFHELAAHLDFYQKLKLVNYIRRQIHANRCSKCDFEAASSAELNVHLREEKHCVMPDIALFDQPEFYFPTYENDTFLYFLEDLE